MKKLFIITFLFLISFFCFIPNSFAFYESELNQPNACKDGTFFSCRTYDEDGNSILDSGDPIPTAIINTMYTATFGENVKYWTLAANTATSIAISLAPYPVYADTLRQSIIINHTWVDGVSKFQSVVVPFSMDISLSRPIGRDIFKGDLMNHPEMNFTFDAVEEVAQDGNSGMVGSFVYRVYFRAFAQIGYIPASQGFENMEYFNYKYLIIPTAAQCAQPGNLYCGTPVFYIRNIYNTSLTYSFLNLNFYTFNDYYEALAGTLNRDINKRIKEIQEEYNAAYGITSSQASSFFSSSLTHQQAETGFWESVLSFFASFGSFFSDLFSYLGDFFSDLGDWFSDLLDSIGTFFRHMYMYFEIDSITNGTFMQRLGNLIVNPIEDAFNGNLTFVNMYKNNDPGNISSVVTAPLVAVDRINENCTSVNFSLFNSNVNVKCGTELFWNRSDVSSFRNIWNILFGGSIIYFLTLNLFKVFRNALDPNDSSVKVVGGKND